MPEGQCKMFWLGVFCVLPFWIVLLVCVCVFSPLVGSQGSIDEIRSCWEGEKGESEPFQVKVKV